MQYHLSMFTCSVYLRKTTVHWYCVQARGGFKKYEIQDDN